MTTNRLIQNSFNAGEWSPILEGRIDIAKYANSCHRLENMLLYPHGPARRRPGFRFIQECKETYSPTAWRSLELKFNNNVTDSSPNNVTVTNTGAVTFDNADYKTGTHSAVFDGTNDYLSMVDSELFNFYQRDFFIAFWIKPNACTTNQTIYHQRTDANNGMEIRIEPGFDPALSKKWLIKLLLKVAGTETTVLTSNYWPGGYYCLSYGFTENVWYHIAIGRRKNIYYLFVNGNLDTWGCGTTAYAMENDMDPANYTGTVYIGQNAAGTQRYDGRLDYFTIAKVCEHQATFTPPTTETETYTCSRWRLIPFQFSTEQTYIIELGHRYARFYRDQGAILSSGSPYEISTPWHEDDLDDLKFCQSVDTLYVVHPDYPPVEITRTGHTAWTCGYMSFDPAPTKEQGHAPTDSTETLTPGATDGNDVTFTSGAAMFISGDVGRIISGNGGRALITTVTNTTTVVCDILTPFPSVSAIASTDWEIEGSPNDILTPSKIGPVNTSCTLTATSLDCFRTSDVGKFITIYGGVVKIKKRISATQVRGRILKVLWQADDPFSTADPIGTKNWYIESEAWTPANGWPSTCAFFEDRLFLGGTDTYPETIWGSNGGNYTKFKAGIKDNQSVEFTLGGREINNIKWIEPRESLMVGATSGEWKLGPADKGAPLTPLNVVARQVSIFGCANMQPLAVRNSTIFLQRHSRKLRELTYKWEEDAWNAPDLTILAEHITREGIVDMAYQQEPLSIIWCVRADGVLLGLTYLRDEDVIGWHRHITDGEFQNIATIPSSTQDELWAIVKRNIAGTDQYFVEMMEAVFQDDDNEYAGNGGENAFFVDCGLTYNGSAATTITGLSHLNGEEVAILADGKVHDPRTVANGAIRLDYPASIVHAGLSYRSLVETMRPTSNKADGSGQGRFKRIVKAIVRVFTSGPFKVGRDDSDAGLVPIKWPLHAETFTGDLPAIMPTRPTREGRMVVVQDDPLPLTLIAIMADLEMDE